jgi:hypothetical protein
MQHEAQKVEAIGWQLDNDACKQDCQQADLKGSSGEVFQAPSPDVPSRARTRPGTAQLPLKQPPRKPGMVHPNAFPSAAVGTASTGFLAEQTAMQLPEPTAADVDALCERLLKELLLCECAPCGRSSDERDAVRK